MPARTVVFTSVRKFDGAAFRWISGGEYVFIALSVSLPAREEHEEQ
jgi:hypothetical protein